MEPDKKPEDEAKPEEGESLEGAQNEDENALESTDNGESGESKEEAPLPDNKPGGLKGFIQRFNLYLVLFGFVLVIAGVVIGIAYLEGKKTNQTVLKGQDLSSTVLSQLAASDATVGDAKQVLNVQANAVFAGKVLVRSSLETAGNLQVGGSVILNTLSVSDTSSLGQVNVSKNLAVSGDVGIQGQLSVSRGLQVTGNGTFSGSITAPQITTPNLQLNGDLVLTHHITAGGSIPARQVGIAVGAGGTASVSGSDTAGSVSVNTGSSTVAGCFITLTFAQRYTSTPHVIVTPIGPDAGFLDFYVNRTSTQFSICDSTAPPTGTSFGFDYFVVN